MFAQLDRGMVACGVAFCLLALGLDRSASGDNPVRVLIVSGGGEHDWRRTSPVLKRILAGTGRFDVRVCEVPVELSPRILADFDLLVEDAAGPAPGSDSERAIAGFVESGKGLVITHGALSSPNLAEDGPVRSAGAVHTPVQFFAVKFTRPEHPIVQGMESGFRKADATCGCGSRTGSDPR